MTFWFVPLEIFRPVFPVETSQWKVCVPFTDFLSLLFSSPVPYLSWSFNWPDLGFLEWNLANGTRSSQTEIPNINFPNVFVNGKRP